MAVAWRFMFVGEHEKSGLLYSSLYKRCTNPVRSSMKRDTQCIIQRTTFVLYYSSRVGPFEVMSRWSFQSLSIRYCPYEQLIQLEVERNGVCWFPTLYRCPLRLLLFRQGEECALSLCWKILSRYLDRREKHLLELCQENCSAIWKKEARKLVQRWSVCIGSVLSGRQMWACVRPAMVYLSLIILDVHWELWGIILHQLYGYTHT